MKNTPQLENGYTRVSNQLLEQVAKQKLNGTQVKIILVVWRFTYGFNRKSHQISLSFLAEAISTSKSVVKKELDKLIELNVLKVVKEATFSNPREISFNKYFKEWGIPIGVQSINKDTVSQESSSQYTNRSTQQYTNRSTKKESKDNIKESANTSNASTKNKTEKDVNRFFEEAWQLYPSKKGKGQVSKSKKKEIYKLGDEFKRCIERYIADVEKQRRNGFKELRYKNGSTFFNSGYHDYLDKNFIEDEKSKVKEPYKPKYRNIGYL